MSDWVGSAQEGRQKRAQAPLAPEESGTKIFPGVI